MSMTFLQIQPVLWKLLLWIIVKIEATVLGDFCKRVNIEDDCYSRPEVYFGSKYYIESLHIGITQVYKIQSFKIFI